MRLAAIAQAKIEIEARAKERFGAEQRAYEQKIAARAERQAKTGKKPGGKPPAPPTDGPKSCDQVNLTDDESRIMESADGFARAYNAQALVDVESKLIVGNFVTQQTNDFGQVAPALEVLQSLPAELGVPQFLLADMGYYSERIVNLCEDSGVTPLIARKRESHCVIRSCRYTIPVHVGTCERVLHC